MNYDIVLWDVDETLLDFKYSERLALKNAFEVFGMSVSDQVIRRYSEINDWFWKRLEKGEVTRNFLLKKRFSVLFAEMHLSGIPVEKFEKVYRSGLGIYVKCNEDAEIVLASLHGKVKQFLVTNGVGETQRIKIHNSGIGKYVDDVFISEEMGADKPGKLFFTRCFEKIGEVDPDRVLIVGDSLSSDIPGGRNAGIHTCWYRNNGQENHTDIQPDYTINSLKEVYKIVLGEGE